MLELIHMPKNIPKKIARDLARLGEEVIKEGMRQPTEMVKTAGEQIGILPRGWGEKPEPQISTQMIEEKEEERRKKLKMARRRIKELKTKPLQPEQEVPKEKIERQRELAEEAEKKKEVPKVPGRKRRGSALLSLRVKKRKGTGETKSGI